MKENLLTNKEIEEIQEDAKDLKYQQHNLLHLGKEKTSIFKVSPDTGLILINGNSSTGLEHIDNRHSKLSRIPYWNKEEKIGNPSKFSLSLPPIRYLAVADQIFKPNNLNKDKNKKTKLFDLYIGKASLQNLSETDYTLITYKETKIIHTMFANKRPFNKKKVLDLRQGWASGLVDEMTGVQTFKIPYFDNNDIELFKVVIRTDLYNGTEGWYIQVNNKDGKPHLTTKIKVKKISSVLRLPYRIMDLDFGNITWVEKQIKRILNGKYEF